jgi:hypothetical protein
VARSDRSFYTEEIHYLDGTITMMSDREAVLETDHDLPLTALSAAGWTSMKMISMLPRGSSMPNRDLRTGMTSNIPG